MKKVTLLLLSAILMALGSNGQNVCGTDAIYQKLKQEHPEIATYEAQLELSIKAGMQKINLARFAKLSPLGGYDDSTIYDIPIVVHVIHDYGNEYLADTAIYDAVNYWISVYKEQNADTADVIAPFKKYIGNPKIRLHLATIDPNGNPTKGITRHQSYLTFNAGDEAKLDDWPNDSYVNIWFINKFSGYNTGAAAYAYYPSSGAYFPYYDGIIGLSSYLNYDKAIPHEMGHVLNLMHPWGNTNNPDVACGDDSVDDTPPTKGHLPSGCVPSALYDTTCAGNYFKSYPSAIAGVDSIVNYPDTVNAQNIMDYTYCQKMFTKGQVERMRLALTNTLAGRDNLYSPANLAKTGALAPMPDLPPIADFVLSSAVFGGGRNYYLCENSSFVFKNESWNDTITSVNWTFSNSPVYATSPSMNVTNSFSQPGWVSVSLTATSNAGSNTIKRDSAVYVADTTVYQPGNYVQNFSSKSEFANWPAFNYYNNPFKWDWYNGAGYNDGACVKYRSYDDRPSPANKSGTPAGDYDDLYTPAFDVSNTGTLNLDFYTAGSYNGNGAIQDSMQIWISTDCGYKWAEIAVLQGTNLINNGAQTSEFTPSSSGQWNAQTIKIPAAYHASKAFFRFRYWPGNNGNNLYMDKFSISPWTTDVKEVMTSPASVKIFPNPAHGNSTLMFVTGNDGKVSYEIRDIAGRLIYQKQGAYSPNTMIEETITRSLFPATGMYLVTVTIEHNSSTEKLMID